MALALAILTLLSTLIGLWGWWLKRKKAPTPEERREDSRTELQKTLCKVYELRQIGDNAQADAIMARLSARGVGGRVYNSGQSAVRSTNPDGQRLGGNTPKGN